MLMYDIEDSKSSGYNVDIFDDDTGDDPNRANTGINDLESSAYQKHVESRGAYALRGSGPVLKQRTEMSIGRSMVTVGYDEDGERKSDVIDTEKYNIDPIGFTGGEGVSSNRLSNAWTWDQTVMLML